MSTELFDFSPFDSLVVSLLSSCNSLLSLLSLEIYLSYTVRHLVARVSVLVLQLDISFTFWPSSCMDLLTSPEMDVHLYLVFLPTLENYNYIGSTGTLKSADSVV